MKEESFESYIKEKLEQYDSGAPMHVWERIKKEKEERKYGVYFWKRYGWFFMLLFLSAGIGLVLKETIHDAPNVADVTGKSDPALAVNNRVTGSGSMHQPESASASVAQDREYGTGEMKLESDREQNIVVASDQPTCSSSAKETESIKLRSKKEQQEVSIKHQQIIQKPTRKQEKIQSIPPLQETVAFTVPGLACVKHVNKTTNPFQVLPLRSFKSQLLPGCGPIRTGRNDLYLELYAGPDHSIRNFSSAARPVNYIPQRLSVENNRIGFSMGARISKSMGERTLMKTGVNYSQINEQMKLVTENEKRLTQIITIRVVVRAPGDTLRVRDTSYYEQTGTNYRTTYNRFRFVDVPVLFSYEFGNPNGLSFAVNAGLVFNIVSFYKGEVLDTSFLPVPITTREGKGVNNWRSNIGYGFYAGLSIQKYVNPNWNLFAEPYIRYNVTPVSQNDSYIQQRYSVYGLQLGVRYNLFANRQQ